MAKQFIKGAIKKEGALRRQLRIPKDKKIPKELLDEIVEAKAGETITNPTNVGKKRIKVTRKMEHRANLARTLREF